MTMDLMIGICALLGAMAMALTLVLGPADFRGNGPVLIVATPWGASAEQIALHAGGKIVGPEVARFGVLASFPAEVPLPHLAALGAWVVRDATRLASLCGVASQKELVG